MTNSFIQVAEQAKDGDGIEDFEKTRVRREEPKEEKELRTAFVQCKLTPTEKERLYKHLGRRSASDLVRNLLLDYLDKHE